MSMGTPEWEWGNGKRWNAECNVEMCAHSITITFRFLSVYKFMSSTFKISSFKLLSTINFVCAKMHRRRDSFSTGWHGKRHPKKSASEIYIHCNALDIWMQANGSFWLLRIFNAIAGRTKVETLTVSEKFIFISFSFVFYFYYFRFAFSLTCADTSIVFSSGFVQSIVISFLEKNKAKKKRQKNCYHGESIPYMCTMYNGNILYANAKAFSLCVHDYFMRLKLSTKHKKM